MNVAARIALVLLLACAASNAQSQPTATIVNWGHMGVIDDNLGDYIPPGEIRLIVQVEGPVPNPANYTAVLNGTPHPLQTQGNKIGFESVLRIGPASTAKMLVPILLELYHAPTMQVVSRERIVLYDIRDLTIDTARGLGERDAGAGIQITSRGLDRLGEYHAAGFLEPAFEDLITSEFEGVQFETAGACFDLTSADEETQDIIKSSGPYIRARNEARAQYYVYQATKESAPVAAALMCAKNLPKPKDFEVCVDTVAGESHDLSISSIEKADISVAAPDALSVTLETGRIDSSVHVSLEDIRVRWKAIDCAPRPAANSKPADFTGDFAAWTSCDFQEADIPSMDATITFNHGPDSPNAENLFVEDAATSTFQFNGSDIRTTGTCSDAFINDQVRTLLSFYFPEAEAALQTAWNLSTPDTYHAQELDRFLTTIELGQRQPQPLEYENVMPLVGAAGVAGSGVGFVFNTDAILDLQFAAGNVHTTWVDPDGTGSRLEGGGVNTFNQPFDVAYSITTSALNQTLREMSATARLNFSFEPTFSDLGLPPGPGKTANDPAPLTGLNLAQFNSAFIGIGPEVITIQITPSIIPFTHMTDDPFGGAQFGRAPLVYEMGQLHVKFVQSSGADAGKVWLSFYVDLVDPGYGLSLRPVFGAQFLDNGFSDPQWTFVAIENKLVNCPKTPHLSNPMFLNTCEMSLEDSFRDMIAPVLEANLDEMLATLPAPQFFDAAGTSPLPVHLTPLAVDGKVQGENRVTLYGNIAPAP